MLPSRLPIRRGASVVMLALVGVHGCDGPLTFSQRLAGQWRGRPETATERIDREWPAATIGGDPAGKPDELPETTPTVLEGLEGVEVTMRLAADGAASLRLAGAAALRGEWRLVTAEGRRGVIEIEIDRNNDDDEGEAETPGERRRFRLVFVPRAEGKPDRFTLAEQGADPQFGRLLFERIGNAAAGDGESNE